MCVQLPPGATLVAVRRPGGGAEPHFVVEARRDGLNGVDFIGGPPAVRGADHDGLELSDFAVAN